MQNPKISIIIPVYNAEKTIGNILKKLIAQKYKNVEIIVINDGSTDSSLKILQDFANNDSRVIVYSQKNAGPSSARNRGIKIATGDYITFIDSDDDFSDMLIYELASRINDDVDFIMCGMTINNKMIVAPDIYIDNEKTITHYVLKSLLSKNLLYGPYCKIFRSDIILTKKVFFPEDVKYGEDTIFVLNYLLYANNFIVISKLLYEYNYSSSGLASTNNTSIGYRKYRVAALKKFIANGDFSLHNIFLAYLLRCRWIISYFKSIYLRCRNG